MELNATTRTELGKKVKNLRAKNIVPGEIYGHGFKNTHISIDEAELIKAYKTAGESTVIAVSLDGKEKFPAIISNIEKHHLSGVVLSVDLRRVKSDEKIKTWVPIEYIGTDMAAKNGFLLVKVISEIEIEALPADIPHSFTIDITPLKNEGESISVKDLKHSGKVKIFLHPETILTTVTGKEKEEAEEQPAEKTPEEGVEQTTEEIKDKSE